ncbi:MAG TPA: hypothetical protein VLE21_06035 [Candidatus Nitrosocosmicus sp.]|nr:hypothetical protein [Candidatus Nitrosocosmicus sp.]
MMKQIRLVSLSSITIVLFVIIGTGNIGQVVDFNVLAQSLEQSVSNDSNTLNQTGQNLSAADIRIGLGAEMNVTGDTQIGNQENGTLTGNETDSTTDQQMDFEKIREQYLNAWNQTEFRSTFDIFIAPESSSGYGIYQERNSSVFQPGETINLYAEPIGFKHSAVIDEQGNTIYSVGMTADLNITDTLGNVLFEQDGFLNFEHNSYNRVTEVPLDFTVDVTGLPEGEYFLNIRVYDLVSGQSFDLNKPITISFSSA